MPPPSPRSKIDHTKRPLLTHMPPPKDGAGRHRASGWGTGSHNPPTPLWRARKDTGQRGIALSTGSKCIIVLKRETNNYDGPT